MSIRQPSAPFYRWLKYDKVVSNSAFNANLRLYTLAEMKDAIAREQGVVRTLDASPAKRGGSEDSASELSIVEQAKVGAHTRPLLSST